MEDDGIGVDGATVSGTKVADIVWLPFIFENVYEVVVATETPSTVSVPSSEILS